MFQSLCLKDLVRTQTSSRTKARNKLRGFFVWRRAVITVDTDYFFVKENGKYTKVFYGEMLYAEAMQNYVAIHLNGRKLLSYMPLALLERKLPPALFMKVHKSYIVSLQKMNAVEGKCTHSICQNTGQQKHKGNIDAKVAGK